MADFNLELMLHVTSGPFGELGNLKMIYWLKATNYSFLEQGVQGTVLSRENLNSTLVPSELYMSLSEAETIAGLFRMLGFPGRELDINSVIDTSEWWTLFSLQVSLGDQESTLTRSLQCCGFKGDDADSLHCIFARLLQAGKIMDKTLWYSLAGTSNDCTIH